MSQVIYRLAAQKMATKLTYKLVWNKAATRKLFEQVGTQVENLILDLLVRTGEEFNQIARDHGSYDNWTGDLRSSIGYGVLKDGQIIKMGGFTQVAGAGANTALVNFNTSSGKNVSFHASGRSGDGSHGAVTGQALIRELAPVFNQGYVLLGVAGMRYAAHVEAIHNKDVISYAASRAEDFVKEEAKKLFKSINNNG